MNKEVSRDVKLPNDKVEIHRRFSAYWDSVLSKREYPGNSPEEIRNYHWTFWIYMNSNPSAKPFTPLDSIPIPKN